MSDSIGSISNRPSNISDVSGADNQNRIEEDIIDKQTSKIQDELASQDNIEKLSTGKKPSKVGRIMARIAGGILLGVGLAAAAAATVVSLGVAPAVIAAAASAIGGIAGTSIAAGVTGAAGIGCLAGSFVGGRSAEAFVEGQHSKHSSNDNLAMITNGKVNGIKQGSAEKSDKFFGLTRVFKHDSSTSKELEKLLANKYQLKNLMNCAGDNFQEFAQSIDISDPAHPKLSNDEDSPFTSKLISEFVLTSFSMLKSANFDLTRDNIALVRYTINVLLSKPDFMGDSYENFKAMTNSSFIDQLYEFTEKEIEKKKDSFALEDKLNLKYLLVFKAALKLSDEDIKTLESQENIK